MEMNIFWHCYECDSKNAGFSGENTFCNVCDEIISDEEKNRCFYEIADSLYKKAITANDYLNVSEHFSKILDYKDASLKYNECKFQAEKAAMNEEIYQKATLILKQAQELVLSEKLNEAEKEFELAQLQFEKITGYSDADEKARKCRNEVELCQSKRIYFEAKEILFEAATIEDYQKAADLFSKISKFTDAQINYETCIKFINNLKAEQQYNEILEQSRAALEEEELDKKINLLQEIIDCESTALSDKTKKIISECKQALDSCLKQKKAIQTKQDYNAATEECDKAKLITKHTERIKAFENIKYDYRAYSKTNDFAHIFKRCDDGIAEANLNIAYENAQAMMDKATDSDSFKKAAKAFEGIKFKDSDKKRKECLEKAELSVKEAAYKDALDTFEKGRSINILNWMKNK